MSAPPRPSSGPSERPPLPAGPNRAPYRPPQPARRRRPPVPAQLRLLRQAGWVGGLGVLALTASWWVSRQFWLADSVNLFRPVVVVLAAALVALAFAARAPALIGASVLLVAANLYLLLQPTLELPAARASGARLKPVSVASFDVVSDERRRGRGSAAGR